MVNHQGKVFEKDFGPTRRRSQRQSMPTIPDPTSTEVTE